MGHPAVGTRVERGEMIAEADADVVGSEDRPLGRALQAVPSHHPAIHPADRQDGGIAERRRRDSTDRAGRQPPGGMPGEEGDEILDDTHRPHPRPAAAVRNAKRLVEIEVADVAAKLPRRNRADERIHVCPVDVHPPAMGVDEPAQLPDFGLEHAMRARVGDHHRRQPVGILLALGPDLGHVDVAIGVAAGHHHLHPRHLGAGRIGAVGRGGDEADRPVALAAGPLPGLDDQEPRIFPLAAGVRLKGDAGVAGRLAEPLTQLPVEHRISLELVGRREGMNVGEAGPGDRDHLAGGIELHRAAAQRDHAPIKGQILVTQTPDVAEHRRLGVMRVEHRMGEERARAAKRHGDERVDSPLEGTDLGERLPVACKHLPEGDEVVARRRLIEADGKRPRVERAKVHSGGAGPRGEVGRPLPRLEGQRVEGALATDSHAELGEAGGEDRRVGGDALGDTHEAIGPVVNRIHARHHGGEDLGGADVGGGLLAADVLLAGLEGEPVGGVAVGIDAHADEPARHRSLEGVAAGEEGGVRPAAAHRHSEALRRAEDDVGPPFPRRGQEREREDVGRHAEERVLRVDLFSQTAVVGDRAIGGRNLHEGPEEGLVAVDERGNVADDHLDAERGGARLHDLDRLRVEASVDEEHRALAPGRAAGEGHRLGSAGGLVEERGIGDRHPGEFANHRLEVDQRLHPPLADLGLIGGVGGVPGGVFEDVAEDHAGGVGAVIALANEALEDLVAGGDAAQLLERRCFGDRSGNVDRATAGNARRHDAGHERLARSLADQIEHVALVGGIGADVAGVELGRVLEIGEHLPRGGGAGHDKAPVGVESAQRPIRGNPVVLEPERFAAGGALGLPLRWMPGPRPEHHSPTVRSSVRLPERSAFGGLATLS